MRRELGDDPLPVADRSGLGPRVQRRIVHRVHRPDHGRHAALRHGDALGHHLGRHRDEERVAVRHPEPEALCAQRALDLEGREPDLLALEGRGVHLDVGRRDRGDARTRVLRRLLDDRGRSPLLRRLPVQPKEEPADDREREDHQNRPELDRPAAGSVVRHVSSSCPCLEVRAPQTS